MSDAFEKWYIDKVTPVFGEHCEFMKVAMRECWQAALRHGAGMCREIQASYDTGRGGEFGELYDASGECAQAIEREAERGEG